MIVKFLPEAEIELDWAIDYYSYKQINLGYEFLDEIVAGIDIIKYMPDAWQKLSTRTRRYQIRRFPYGVIYTQINNTILIIAIMNLRQKPNYWQDRI